jgi:hypothetical protein
MAYTWREKVRDFKNQMRYSFAWFSVKKGLPTSLSSGSYSWIKLVRFSLVVFALLNSAALALGSPSWNVANLFSLWLGFVFAAFILIAVIYFLGLRMWYSAATGFLIVAAVVNYLFNAAGGPLALSSYTTVTLSTALAVGWLYLVIVGIAIMRYDKGSKLNELLQQS